MATITLAQCTAEICRLHDFFQAWFRGEIAEVEENFQHFAGVMSPDFFIIAPDGGLMTLPPLTTRLRQAYGKQPGVRIWTQQHRLHYQRGDVALCTYEEWQEHNGETTVRLSSVLFQQQVGVPHSLIWCHVHETWIASSYNSI